MIKQNNTPSCPESPSIQSNVAQRSIELEPQAKVSSPSSSIEGVDQPMHIAHQGSDRKPGQKTTQARHRAFVESIKSAAPLPTSGDSCEIMTSTTTAVHQTSGTSRRVVVANREHDSRPARMNPPVTVQIPTSQRKKDDESMQGISRAISTRETKTKTRDPKLSFREILLSQSRNTANVMINKAREDCPAIVISRNEVDKARRSSSELSPPPPKAKPPLPYFVMEQIIQQV